MDEQTSHERGSGTSDAASPAAEAPVTAMTRVSPASEGSGESSSATGASGLLAQFQRLIEQVLAAPVTREVAAKAAELAALAAEKAGPAARSIAVKTEEVGQSVAVRATTFASSMRSDEDAPAGATSGDGTSVD